MATPPLDEQRLHKLVASVWESHDDEEYRKDQSHWRGVGRWKDDERWLRIGKRTIEVLRQVELLTSRKVLDRRPVALEWGPGGGANAFALKDYASVLYGIDVSPKNLAEAGRLLGEAGYSGFRPVLMTDSLARAVEELKEPIDVFVSTAVFQHFPSKAYGLEVLKRVSEKMAPDAIGRLQIRYDNGNPKYAPKSLSDYKKSHITATSYAIDEFWDALSDVGIEPVGVSISSKSNYANYLIAKKG